MEGNWVPLPTLCEILKLRVEIIYPKNTNIFLVKTSFFYFISVLQIREEKEFDNLAKMYLAELIRKECWDDMEVKGRGITVGHPFTIVNNITIQAPKHSFVSPPLAVRNYCDENPSLK